MFTFLNNSIAFYNQLPEVFLSVCILLQLLFNLNFKNSPGAYYSNLALFSQSLIILILTLILSFNCQYNATYLNFLLVNNFGTSALKQVILTFSIVALAPITYAFNLQKLTFFEYFSLYLFAVLSTILLVSAGDFLTVYLLIEMQSLCFYILATYNKTSIFSVDAGIKYFIFGSIISCILLFALSFLYGALGTLKFHDINLLLFSFPFSNEYSGINSVVLFSLALICLVFFFKLAIVPFHFWVPDVYEGAPLSSTIIFSFLPKLVLFDLFIRISKVFGPAFKELDFLFIFCGLFSVLVGSFFALSQTRIKRFFIYSSISQMGFPIIVLSSTSFDAYTSIYFFLIVYTISSLLSWSLYIILYQFIHSPGFSVSTDESSDTPLYLSDLSYLYGSVTNWTFLFSLFVFSLAGIPPLAGFLSKFLIVFSLVQNKYYISSILLVFFSAISTFYYVRVVKLLFFEPKIKSSLRFNFYFDQNNLFYKLTCFFICFYIIVLFHILFFLDFWLYLSEYINVNSIF
jgi:NADH-quinone oxidoreductase subunit N